MRARTYRAVAPIDPAVTSNTIGNIGRVLLIVAVLLVVVVSVRWFGERRMQRTITPTVAAQSADTITLSIDRPEWPELTELRFVVDVVDNAYILIDVDGDQFRCTNRPVTVADMELCTHHATIEQ